MSSVRERTRLEKAQSIGWMLASLFIAAGVLTVTMEILAFFGYPRELGLSIVAILATDAIIWEWGVKRFDIVAPKPFRAAAENEH